MANIRREVLGSNGVIESVCSECRRTVGYSADFESLAIAENAHAQRAHGSAEQRSLRHIRASLLMKYVRSRAA